jgi:predicted ATPase/class 3 adenylate cyclase
VETLVLVLTDVQGSTRLWAEEPEEMDAAMRRHHEIVHGAIAEHGGIRPPDQGEGDAVFAAFGSPTAAVSAVVQFQRELHAEPWPTSRPLSVRVGVHVGEVRVRDRNLFGDPVNRCARIRGLGSGGQSLLSAAVFELVRDQLPAGVSVQDLGEHRMKDLTRAEHIFQLDHADLPGHFPPLASLNRAKHNLPVQTSSFVGREREVDALVAAVRQHRLVTVVGFGGMGKTRLALQAAAQLGDGDGDGVWLIDLAPVTDPARVPAEIAAALSISETADGSAAAVLRAVADKKLLLVLDNVEQVLDCAHFVAELFAAAPGVHVLATSREPLRVRGEQQFPLDPMSLPQPDAAAEKVAVSDAARLFVERARSVRPDFAVSAANAATLSGLCAHLDGQPLALELAAARMKMLTIDSLLQRLQAGQQLLAGGSRDVPERQRTLRATIAWSVDALKPEERQLLAALSILPAPASFDLIEAIAGSELDTFTLLDSLVEKSLVRTVDAGDETRYGLLVSIRDYAAEALTTDQRRTYRERHADYVAAKLHIVLNDDAASEDAHDVFVARELAHIRAAISHRRTAGPPESEVAIVADIDTGMSMAGLDLEYLDISAHALQQTVDPAARSRIMIARTLSFSGLGRFADSQRAAEDALAEGRRSGSARFLAHAITIAMIYGVGSPQQLIELDEELAPLLRQQTGLNRIATEEARNYAFASRLIVADPQRAEAAAGALLGTYADVVGKQYLIAAALARNALDEAAAIAIELEDPRYEDHVYAYRATIARAMVALALGDAGQASVLARRVFEGRWSEGGYPASEAALLADAEHRQGRPEAAHGALTQALTRAPSDRDWQTGALRWRHAALLREQGGHTLQAASELDLALNALVDEPFSLSLPDLLSALVERAAQSVDEDPGQASTLLGSVEAHARTWTLPFDGGRTLGELRARLLPDHESDWARGRDLDPNDATRQVIHTAPEPAS